MTAVAAIARGGEVVMAADECTNCASTELLGARKIERVRVGSGEALLAVAGNSGLLALAARLWRCEAEPDPDDERDVRLWAYAAASTLTGIAAAASPALLRDAGDGSQVMDGEFLLGWRGRLIYLFTHAALVVPDGVAALGIGADVALGAMRVALDLLGDDPISRRLAVSRGVVLAAAQHAGTRVGPRGPLIEEL